MPQPLLRVSVSVLSSALVLAIGALLVVPVAPLSAQKGKPPSTPPDATATVVFAEDGGFAMVSDGNGPYAGATIFGASGDLRLDLTAGTREIWVTLGSPSQLAPGIVPPAPGTYETDAVLYIQGIRGVAKGSTVRRVGRIGFGDSLPDHALGFRYTTSQGIVINGTEACVRRLTDAEAGTTTPTWRVTSSAGCAASDGDNAGVFEENLKGKINQKWKGTYAVPFSITVSCTTNCSM